MDPAFQLSDLAASSPQSAVEKFAVLHGRKELEAGSDVTEKTYRSLIPTSLPDEGEQYAFEVDLDRCSACKACVSACHHMNGLSSDESWRRVEQWFGESKNDSWFQTITSACHHCVNPECMLGCPVGAYEKSPLTGIVKHLDDQCIGCEYCIWKCPYEVPKYHESHGVVRKCDMCSERLENQLEPACVQACPHDAIQIGIASQDALINDLTHKRTLNQGIYPGAPPSSITQPSSQYKSSHPRSEIFWTSLKLEKPEEKAHWPLIWMLVLSQWGIGMLVGEWMYALKGRGIGVVNEVYFLGIGLFFAGLMASVFHLGRPQKAWKFFLGLRTSWLSREILMFNIFSCMVVVDVLNRWFSWLPETISSFWPGLLIFVGFGAVWSSCMIYHDTRRPQWDIFKTASRFYGTVLLGLAFQTMVSKGFSTGSTSGVGLILACLVALGISGAKVIQILSRQSARIHHLLSQKLITSSAVLLTLSLFILPYMTHTFLYGVGLTAAFILCLSMEILERFVFFKSSTPPVTQVMHSIVKK